MSSSHGLALVLVLVLAVIASAVPVIKTFKHEKNNKDYSKWWGAALKVRGGEALFPPEAQYFGDFIYPPSSAVMLYAPLSLPGLTGMVVLLCLLTAAAHLFAIYASVYFACGRWRDQHVLLYVVPFAWTAPFAWDIYVLGQFNLTMLGLMMGGLLLLHLGRQVGGGALLALATAAKAFPLTVVVYLLWRRHWLALASLVVTLGVVMFVLPGAIRGYPRHYQETAKWIDRMILSSSSTSLANQPWRAYRSGNQSLLSVVNRLTRPTENPDWPSKSDDDFNANLVDLGPRGSMAVALGLVAVLCLAYLLAMPAKARITRRTAGLEAAVLLMLIVMVSPKAGTYYYCWSLPAVTMLMAEWLAAPAGSRRRLWLGVGMWTSLLILATALSQALNIPGPQTYGATFLGNLVLLITLLATLCDAKRSPGLQATTAQALSAPPEASQSEPAAP